MSTSSINFESAYSNAELKEATDVFRQWLNEHESLHYFTFDQLCSDLSKRIPADHLNRVLLRLVAAGQLQIKYRVKLDEGEYSEEEFDSPEEVPPLVFDSAFEPFMVSDDDKVPSYAPAR
jgi:hypothetical protein